MYRTKIKEFIKWKLNKNRKPLVFLGARQVGKTWLDFIVQNEEDEIIPVEVKSGTNLRARSFKLFCEKFQPQTAIRTSLTNYLKESWLTNVPLYIVGDYFNKKITDHYFVDK